MIIHKIIILNEKAYDLIYLLVENKDFLLSNL